MPGLIYLVILASDAAVQRMPMDQNFKYKATLKSDEELNQLISDREKYLPESVEAAVEELQSRGQEFSDEELTVIAEDMQARRDLAKEHNDGFMMYTSNGVNQQVEDPDAPLLYSKRAILVFSILFSVFFGSVMLAINLSKTEHKNKAVLAALAGFGYTAAIMLLGSLLNLNSGFAIILGWVGAYSLDLIFWKRFIGNTTLYRLRPIWVPLAIGAGISIVILTLMYKYNGFNLK